MNQLGRRMLLLRFFGPTVIPNGVFGPAREMLHEDHSRHTNFPVRLGKERDS
jgi:hypothetical protein